MKLIPVAFGKVIVLSAVGSVTVNVVSFASFVEPSNTIELSVNVKPLKRLVMLLFYLLKFENRVNVAPVLSIAKVTVSDEETEVSISMIPPVNVNVSVPHANTSSSVPLSAAISNVVDIVAVPAAVKQYLEHSTVNVGIAVDDP